MIPLYYTHLSKSKDKTKKKDKGLEKYQRRKNVAKGSKWKKVEERVPGLSLMAELKLLLENSEEADFDSNNNTVLFVLAFRGR